jgi:hypothetical protein
VRLSSLVTVATIGLFYQPQTKDDGDCGTIGGAKIGGETEVLGENLPTSTLSTTYPTSDPPSSNPGLRGEKPATNRLNCCTAIKRWLEQSVIFAPLWSSYKSRSGKSLSAGLAHKHSCVCVDRDKIPSLGTRCMKNRSGLRNREWLITGDKILIACIP